ncbi:hypothetical protein HMI54_009205 [Coelomomyces lativittatus]|nr:hypothetical protein HMI54_009205 [Coelomomyces lativittatus]
MNAQDEKKAAQASVAQTKKNSGSQLSLHVDDPFDNHVKALSAQRSQGLDKPVPNTHGLSVSQVDCLVDSGCTEHVVPHIELVQNPKPTCIPVYIADGSIVFSNHIGNLVGLIQS